MQVGIKVDGKILSELSENIPSSVFALNELIKNSYDAKANCVEISLNSRKKELVISDDGNGMSIETIENLFHIGHSEKKYGQLDKETQRRTQGSKGLGFLAIFRFGSNVVWDTKNLNNESLIFSVDFEYLKHLPNISEYKTDVRSSTKKNKGTQITVQLHEEGLRALKRDFEKEQDYQKIIHNFNEPEDFIVKIKKDGNFLNDSNAKNILEQNIQRCLFHVTYDTTTENLQFFRIDLEDDGKKNKKVQIKKLTFLSPKFKDENCKISLDLVIFFNPIRDEINKLFWGINDQLTPLTYVNSNLFQNYLLFDPSIRRSSQSARSLPQMIGFVNIFSEAIEFNSDRTQFLQDQLTDQIKNFLFEINGKIQDIGSEEKKRLLDIDFLKNQKLPSNYFEKTIDELRGNIKSSFSFKDRVEISRKDREVTYTAFGMKKLVAIIEEEVKNQEDDAAPKLQKAKITLKKSEDRIRIHSGQTTLTEYIESANSSAGDDVKAEVEIAVDGMKYPGNILPSIDFACEKKVIFSYHDAHFGLESRRLVLKFEEEGKRPIQGEKTKEKLLSLPVKSTYKVDYHPVVQNLINQINSLETEKYFEVLACSLRSLFELSADTISNSKNYSYVITEPKDLKKRVGEVIVWLTDTGNKRFITAFATRNKLSHDTMRNKFLSDKFSEAVGMTHLGAHKSGDKLKSKTDLQHAADYAAWFIFITNELMKDDQ